MSAISTANDFDHYIDAWGGEHDIYVEIEGRWYERTKPYFKYERGQRAGIIGWELVEANPPLGVRAGSGVEGTTQGQEKP